MGVYGTFCQICGMPLQHDSYLPDPSDSTGNRFLIYRGPKDSGSQHLQVEAKYRVEHEWLLRCVALRRNVQDEPQVYHTESGVHDGDMELEDGETIDLELGDGERFGLHLPCWVHHHSQSPISLNIG
mmetsp:Transcript_42174/g.66045  ORF Transcript_42174/g.66045 Transcript_42174/m.66045 type:complete len:127 (-) Transcript_42174:1007-1387(-)